MKISYEWLQSFFDTPLTAPSELGERITFGAFEIESIADVQSDTLLDIKVLPDRAHDALSHRGIAHEVSVLTEIPMKYDPLRENAPALTPTASELSVIVDDTKAAPFYGAALMRNIQVGPSPDWLRKRLETIGQRSINNVVDATNYVMFELGSPLHAFDAKKLTNKDGMQITVRPAKPNEKITVLGGTEYTLTEEMTVISDGHNGRALAIGGVKGGVAAEVDQRTTDIILEGAVFNAIRTRKTSQALKLRTDASARFENGIAATLPMYGLEAVVALLSDIAGGELIGFAHSDIPTTSPFVLGVSVNEVNRRLGTAWSEGDIEATLTRLHMQPNLVDPIEQVLTEAPKYVGVPYKRGASVLRDSPHAFDCSSFTAWLFAHAGVSIPRISIDQFVFGIPVEEKDLIPGDLIFANTNEVISTKGEYYSQVLNTMVPEQAIRTTTLEFLPGTDVGHGVDHVGMYLGDGKIIHTSSGIGHVVIEDVAVSAQFKNVVGYRRFAKTGEKRFVVTVPFERLDIRQPADLIEEIGRVQGYDSVPSTPLPVALTSPLVNQSFYWAERVRGALDTLGFTEIMTYTLRDKGEEQLLNPLAADKGYLRVDLASGMQEAIEKNEYYAPLVGNDEVRLYEIGHVFRLGGEATHLSVGARARAGKKRIERTDALLIDAMSAVSEALGGGAPASAWTGEGEIRELDLSTIISEKIISADTYPENSLVTGGLLYTSISTYPFVLRDIALWVPAGLESAAIGAIIREQAGDLLVRLDLFDSFTKEEKVSFAFHLVFQSNERTLSDTEVTAVMQKVTEALTKEGFEIR